MECKPALHISLVAIPDAVLSTLSGIFDVLSSMHRIAPLSDAVPTAAPFEVEIIAERPGAVQLASGVPISAHKSVAAVQETDIVIVPSVLLMNGTWEKGRYPTLTTWLTRMHAQGATLCSACSGAFLIAETGLLNGMETALHWSYVHSFSEAFPEVRVHPELALLTSGEHDRYISSGASSSWHDLVLYLIARHVNPAAAQAVAHFFALQWHRDGLGPYMIFHAPTGHGDALVADAQAWLEANFSVASPVEEMVRRSGVPERSFKRRFAKATGSTAITYVQRLRIEDAKRRLERTDAPVDEISWRVGYEDPAFFRRLFKRTTGITPAAYRRKFEIPPHAATDDGR